MKILIMVLLILIVGLVGIFFYSLSTEEQESKEIYQGPVPEGYDEEHFRLTGETIPNGDTTGN